MTEYITTNIRLPKAMHERIKRRAQEEDKSFAQIVRESVAVYLVGAPARTTESSADDPIFRLADLTQPDEVIGGDRPTDMSVRHDFYLYGTELDSLPDDLGDGDG